jgi:hypothetical protein
MKQIVTNTYNLYVIGVVWKHFIAVTFYNFSDFQILSFKMSQSF